MGAHFTHLIIHIYLTLSLLQKLIIIVIFILLINLPLICIALNGKKPNRVVVITAAALYLSH